MGNKTASLRFDEATYQSRSSLRIIPVSVAAQMVPPGAEVSTTVFALTGDSTIIAPSSVTRGLTVAFSKTFDDSE